MKILPLNFNGGITMDNKKGYNPDFVKEMEEIKKQKTIRISGYDDLYDEGDVLEEEEKS